MKKISIAFALALASGVALAQATPVGLWKQIDDETKAEKTQIRITESNGVFSGKIEKIADAKRQDAVCDKCEGALKDQKILGMTIMTNVKKNPDNDYWDGGTIVKADEGKTFKVRMTLKDGGKSMEVRGFIGPFFRNQTWIRVE